MHALLETTEENPRTESTDSEDESRLTEEEMAILDDPYERPTTDQLFANVRSDFINHYVSKYSVNPTEE